MTIDIAAGRALVAEARASTEGATEGPWRVDSAPDCGVEVCCISAEEVEIVVTDSGTYPPSMKDAAFIANARTLLPQITEDHATALDELEQLRARNAKLEAVVDALPKCERAACNASATYDCVAVGCRALVCYHHWPDPNLRGEIVSELPYAAALRALEKP